MSIDINIKLNINEFPILNQLKKKDLELQIYKIIKTGYNIYFPSLKEINNNIELNEIKEQINNIKVDIKNELNCIDITHKINSLEVSLNKLIGISSNSSKKGSYGENYLEEIINQRYGDIKYEKKNHIPHSGDAWLYLPDNKIIMLESKNYITPIKKEEINKLQFDMLTNNIKWSLLISLNSSIQGMKELDFYTFTHNNETYSIIMISNLSTDLHKLDLGLQIIRKLINIFNDINNFPWIVHDINQNLIELNNIMKKNYILRDNFYNMEKDIINSLSIYHMHIRNYQYELEQVIIDITNKINNTMEKSINSIDYNINIQLLNNYKLFKIYNVLTKIIDIFYSKKWIINIDTFKILSENIEIGYIKIQHNKIIIFIIKNDIIINFNKNKDLENNKNLELLQFI